MVQVRGLVLPWVVRTRPPSYHALLGRQGRIPVVEVLGIRRSEVAGVLSERRLLGQSGEAIDFILVRSCFALGCTGHQQQQEQWRQRGSEHLREETQAEDVYQFLCASVQQFLERRWRAPPGVAPPGSSSPPRNYVRCPSARAFPYLCFPASWLFRRRLWTGSHV